jgi:hypothetical protein
MTTIDDTDTGTPGTDSTDTETPFGDLTPEQLSELREKAGRQDALEAALADRPDDLADDDRIEPDEDESPNAEAARYRVRLREAEQEVGHLRGRIETMQRADVERQLAGRVAQPADIFEIGGVDLADLLDDDGNVVPELVDTAVFGLLESRPGLAYQEPPAAGPSTFGMGKHRPTAEPGPSWGDVIRGEHG